MRHFGKNSWAALLALFLGWFFASAVAAGQTASGAAKNLTVKDLEKIRAFLQVPVETKPFSEAGPMTLAEFLAELEKRLPPENKLSFSIDKDAFGDKYQEVKKAKITFHPYPKKMEMETALRLALYQVHAFEATYDLGPGYMRITTPGHATRWEMVHDVAEVVRKEAQWRPALKRWGIYPGGKPGAGAEGLTGVIMSNVDPEHWNAANPNAGSLTILNGTRLQVTTTAVRHAEIGGLLASLLRLPELAVMMQAELFEVDAKFYAKSIVPLLSKKTVDEAPGVLVHGHGLLSEAATLEWLQQQTQIGNKAPAVIANDGLVKQLRKQKSLVKGDNVKLLDGQKATFLSWQKPFTYLSRGGAPGAEPGKTFQTASHGVSFSAKVEVSASRRCMKLKIIQEATELVEVKKTSALDVTTGKQVPVQAPNLRKATLIAELAVDDAERVLMPVAYQTPEAKAKNRVLVLLLTPVIWIEEEQELIKAAATLRPDDKVPASKPLQQPPAIKLAKTDELEQILKALVADLLTNAELKVTRDVYGTPGDNRVALIVSDQGLSWPDWFQPAVPGFKFQRVKEGKCHFEKNRLLGIRLDKVDLKQKKLGDLDAPIQVAIFNAGGSKNGGTLGACLVFYLPKKKGDKWVIELHGAIDP